MSKYSRLPIEELRQIVQNAKTCKEIAEKLGYRGGSLNPQIFPYLDEIGIDYKHLFEKRRLAAERKKHKKHRRYLKDLYIEYDGFINEFTGDYEFLSPDYKSEFTFYGDRFFTIRDAYNSMRWKIKNGDDAVQLMIDVVGSFYAYNINLQPQLKKLSHTHIEQVVFNHDNFFNRCGCWKCMETESLNYYGQILMEYANYLEWKDGDRKRKYSPKYLGNYIFGELL